MRLGTAMTDLGNRRRGFRCSAIDLMVIAICAIGTIGFLPILGEIAWLFPITLGHFFLFCNVFRIRREFELFWAGVFVVNVACWALAGRFDWLIVLAIQTPLTATLIITECLRSSYHGIFCKKVVDSSPK
ncbi:MAG: hypothetical protein WCJ09_29015 [Planctomycetota bacterium]